MGKVQSFTAATLARLSPGLFFRGSSWSFFLCLLVLEGWRQRPLGHGTGSKEPRKLVSLLLLEQPGPWTVLSEPS